MIQKIFTNMLEISLSTSIVIILVYALSPVLEKKYMASWKYYVWLGIVLRLLIPVPLTIPDPPIQIDAVQIFQESEYRQAPFPEEITIKEEMQSPKELHTSSIADISFLQIGTSIWIIVACGFSICRILQYLYYINNLKRWFQRVNSDQCTIFIKTKADLKIKRKISLYRCKIINSPMMLGIIHPMVLIPNIEYSETDLYLILKHELTHYKRHHIETKFLLFLVQSLYWFNPFVYLMSNKFNEVIEMSCDECVISGNDVIYKKRYMETILQSISQQTKVTSIFTTNYNGGMKTMKKRFENIVENEKKRKGLISLVVLMIICLGLSSMVACSTNVNAASKGKAAQNTTPQTIVNKAVTQEPTKLSKNITGIYAESKPNAELEQTIIKYLEIPDEFLDKTKYYYNYVDLNCDGSDEIFVVVMGPYTSGTGGSTGLHIIQTGTDGMQVNQLFTLINTPIIISDKVTNGCKEIIAMRSGGGAASEYVVLTCSDGQYQTINEGTVIKGLEEVSGKAIICNDLLKDMEEGKILTLKKQ